jgi:hypothetical protein
LTADITNKHWYIRCSESGCTGVLEYTVKNYLRPNTRPENTELPKPIIKKEEPLNTICIGWDFTATPGEWMSVGGRIVPLNKLGDNEFVSSVKSLVHANLDDIGFSLDWVKKLPRFNTLYNYPLGVLKVDVRDVLTKLSEFFEDAKRRGWITPEGA